MSEYEYEHDQEPEIVQHKILIVDNDRLPTLLLSNILKPTYSVFSEKDGKAAIKFAKENSPDLILLDVVMPDMSGHEVLIELKKDLDTSKIPVIFITGLDGAADEEKGFELGAVDYITKPFRDSVVRARVKTHLQVTDYIRRIEALGMTDLLTQLNNRRSFDNQLDIEWSRAMRENSPLSILMIDIDHFKKYNDSYGHLKGDETLKIVADVFKKSSKRKTDFVARWGGEEFAILLPGTDIDGAFSLAEDIRLNIEQTPIPLKDGDATSVTISIGAATKIPSKNDTITDFISAADNALYIAKRTGRNKVVSS